MQNDKEKFKKDFIRRLIKFSLDTINFVSYLKIKENVDEVSKIIASSLLTLKGKR